MPELPTTVGAPIIAIPHPPMPIAMLVVKYLQLRSTFAWSLSNLIALLRHQLFVYRDLTAWLNAPFHPPPDTPPVDQLSLELT